MRPQLQTPGAHCRNRQVHLNGCTLPEVLTDNSYQGQACLAVAAGSGWSIQGRQLGYQTVGWVLWGSQLRLPGFV